MINLNPPHNWTAEEDMCCTEMFFKYYVEGHDITDVSYVVSLIKNKFPNLKQKSIKMRLQNIKAICNELKIANSCPLPELYNFCHQEKSAVLIYYLQNYEQK